MTDGKRRLDVIAELVECAPYRMRLRREACVQRQQLSVSFKTMPLQQRRKGAHLKINVTKCFDCSQGRAYREELEQLEREADTVASEQQNEDAKPSPPAAPRPNWRWSPKTR